MAHNSVLTNGGNGRFTGPLELRWRGARAGALMSQLVGTDTGVAARESTKPGIETTTGGGLKSPSVCTLCQKR